MIYAQYNNATNFINLITGISSLININIEDFHRTYFDIDTCGTEGLDNWGRIIGQNRSLNVPDYKYKIGFGDQINPHNTIDYPQNFHYANFYGGETQIIELDDTDYRQFLKFVYLLNNTNNSIQSINRIMNKYFQLQDVNYKVRVLDFADMSMQFQFNFVPRYFERYIFLNSTFLPIPMGVSYTTAYSQPF